MGDAGARGRRIDRSRVVVLVLLFALMGQMGCEGTLRRIRGRPPAPEVPDVPELPEQPEAPKAPEPGTVKGRVFLLSPESVSVGAAEAEAEPVNVVVYLDRLDEGEGDPASPRATTIRHTEGPLWAEPMVVAQGQAIRFTNEDEVYHRIFSSSETNRFDLGVIKTSQSRELTLRNLGIVRVYCSLHPWERGSIFVAPSLRFHTVEPPGRYEIVDVPPGRYRIATWGEALPSTSRVVTVRPGKAVSMELAIKSRGVSP